MFCKEWCLLAYIYLCSLTHHKCHNKWQFSRVSERYCIEIEERETFEKPEIRDIYMAVSPPKPYCHTL